MLTISVYVIAVWNTYRKAHLMILDAILRSNNRMQVTDQVEKQSSQAQQLATDIAASIPFHLIRNPEALLLGPSAPTDGFVPGRAAGGLLMLHPLWVITISSSISDEMRSRMRKCLAWIGDNMGIGQAITLSNVSIFGTLQ